MSPEPQNLAASLGAMLAAQAARQPEAEFVRFREKTYSYRDVDAMASRIARGLRDQGFSKGDRIAVLLPNCAEYVFFQFGIARAGMAQVPLNTEAQGPVLCHFINNAEPRLLVTTAAFLPRLRALEGLQAKPALMLLGGPPEEEGAGFSTLSYTRLAEAPPQAPEVELEPQDLAAIFYTSGTTGVSKGVMLSHSHQRHLATLIATLAGMTAKDVIYSAFPYYHGVSQYMAVLPALVAGASCVIAEKFSASRYWDDIRHYGATVSWSVMTIPAALMKQPRRPDDADNPLRVMFGMGIDPNVWAQFEERFGLTFVNSFGSTETNLIIACPPGVAVPNRRTSGRATADFEVAIVDDSDTPLPAGETGYIVSRPRLPWTQMLGYFRMPEETLKATGNLWMHNGDMGYVDAEGWFYFTGRGKDAMRIGGENVSAQEIEAILDSHPAVLESAVFAVAGELGEDEVKADICLRPAAQASAAEILDFCRSRMSKHMVPRYVQFRAELPKTGTEKIQKAKLKEQGLTPETWDSRRHAYLGRPPQ